MYAVDMVVIVAPGYVIDILIVHNLINIEFSCQPSLYLPTSIIIIINDINWVNPSENCG